MQLIQLLQQCLAAAISPAVSSLCLALLQSVYSLSSASESPSLSSAFGSALSPTPSQPSPSFSSASSPSASSMALIPFSGSAASSSSNPLSRFSSESLSQLILSCLFLFSAPAFLAAQPSAGAAATSTSFASSLSSLFPRFLFGFSGSRPYRFLHGLDCQCIRDCGIQAQLALRLCLVLAHSVHGAELLLELGVLRTIRECVCFQDSSGNGDESATSSSSSAAAAASAMRVTATPSTLALHFYDLPETPLSSATDSASASHSYLYSSPPSSSVFRSSWHRAWCSALRLASALLRTLGGPNNPTLLQEVLVFVSLYQARFTRLLALRTSAALSAPPQQPQQLRFSSSLQQSSAAASSQQGSAATLTLAQLKEVHGITRLLYELHRLGPHWRCLRPDLAETHIALVQPLLSSIVQLLNTGSQLAAALLPVSDHERTDLAALRQQPSPVAGGGKASFSSFRGAVVGGKGAPPGIFAIPTPAVTPASASSSLLEAIELSQHPPDLLPLASGLSGSAVRPFGEGIGVGVGVGVGGSLVGPSSVSADTVATPLRRPTATFFSPSALSPIFSPSTSAFSSTTSAPASASAFSITPFFPQLSSLGRPRRYVGHLGVEYRLCLVLENVVALLSLALSEGVYKNGVLFSPLPASAASSLAPSSLAMLIRALDYFIHRFRDVESAVRRGRSLAVLRSDRFVASLFFLTNGVLSLLSYHLQFFIKQPFASAAPPSPDFHRALLEYQSDLKARIDPLEKLLSQDRGEEESDTAKALISHLHKLRELLTDMHKLTTPSAPPTTRPAVPTSAVRPAFSSFATAARL